MEKVNSKEIRMQKTKNVKSKRSKLAKIFMDKSVDTKQLGDDASVFHNMRRIMRGIRNKALGMIMKKDALHEYYNKDERSQEHKRERKRAKSELKNDIIKNKLEEN